MKRHTEYYEEVRKIVKSKDYSKLLNYTEFNLEKNTFRYNKENQNDELYDVLCFCDNFEVVKYILDNSIDLECNATYGTKPIHYICFNVNVIKLLKHLSDKNINLESEDINGLRPIHYICYQYKTLKWAIQSKLFNLDLSIKTNEDKNYIDVIYIGYLKRLLDEDVIQVRNCGYVIRYLQEEQTVSMCQDAIDHDPSNIQYVREDLKRYFQ